MPAFWCLARRAEEEIRRIAEPHNADALAGNITAFAFDKMEEAEWTGTIEHFDGREEEITVPLMKDTETGRTVLGDLKRKILCAD